MVLVVSAKMQSLGLWGGAENCLISSSAMSQLRIPLAQRQHLLYRASPLLCRQDLRQFIADLRCEQTEPHLPDLLARGPELQEFLEIPRPLHHLTRDGAMHGHLVARDVLNDPIVGRGCAPGIVLRLQSVDRDHHVQFRHADEGRRQDTKRARHHLNVNPTINQLRHHRFEFAVAHQRIAAHQRKVQWLQAVGDSQHPFHQCVPLSVRQFAQRGAAAQMARLIRITTWTTQRAFASDFNRQRGLFALQDLAPGLNNFRSPQLGFSFRCDTDKPLESRLTLSSKTREKGVKCRLCDISKPGEPGGAPWPEPKGARTFARCACRAPGFLSSPRGDLQELSPAGSPGSFPCAWADPRHCPGMPSAAAGRRTRIRSTACARHMAGLPGSPSFLRLSDARSVTSDFNSVYRVCRFAYSKFSLLGPEQYTRQGVWDRVAPCRSVVTEDNA